MDTVAYRRMQQRASTAEAALRVAQQALAQAQADRRRDAAALVTVRAQFAEAEQDLAEADHLRVQLQQSRDEQAGAEEHARVLAEQLEQTQTQCADTARLSGEEIVRLVEQLADRTAAVERLQNESRGLDAALVDARLQASRAEARAAELEQQLAALADRQDLVRRLQRERDARHAAEREAARLRRELAARPEAPRPVYVLGPAETAAQAARRGAR